MNDPLFNKPSELIIEGELQGNDKLRIKMLEDVSLMTQETKYQILNAMLKMLCSKCINILKIIAVIWRFL